MLKGGWVGVGRWEERWNATAFMPGRWMGWMVFVGGGWKGEVMVGWTSLRSERARGWGSGWSGGGRGGGGEDKPRGP